MHIGKNRQNKLSSAVLWDPPFYFELDKDKNEQFNSTGIYFQHEYNRHVGVKVFKETKIGQEHASANLLLRARGAHEDVIWEAALINSFYQKRIAVVRFCFDRVTKDQYLGIVMLHFAGRHPYSILQSFYCPKKDRVYRQAGKGRIPLASAINQRAAEIGFYLGDIHERNVVVDSQGRPWPIDFGVGLAQRFKDFKFVDREFSWIHEDFKRHYERYVR